MRMRNVGVRRNLASFAQTAVIIGERERANLVVATGRFFYLYTTDRRR